MTPKNCISSQALIQSVTEEVCVEYLNVQTWSSYNGFLLHASKTLNVIQFNEANWKLSKCSCYRWCKEYTCKHMLAFAVRKCLFYYPIQAKNVKFGCNRRRGRPRLTAAALEYQFNEVIEECVLSDCFLPSWQRPMHSI